MSKLGMGAAIHMLGGGSKESADKYYGRKISAASFTPDVMKLTFEDGVSIAITDDGQSCCESRYMTCDDDVSILVGKTLKRIEVRESESTEPDEHSIHEIAFLEIGTDQNMVSFATHVEHNGYYGGFGLNIAEVSR